MNLPSPLREHTTQAQLALIARSVEKKLYRVAASPISYNDMSTLELRIAALATAVLIHTESVRQKKEGKIGEQSEFCSRLSAAARKSLVHCATVLVSYEKRQLDKFARTSTVANFADVQHKSSEGDWKESSCPVPHHLEQGFPQGDQHQMEKRNTFCGPGMSRPLSEMTFCGNAVPESEGG